MVESQIIPDPKSELPATGNGRGIAIGKTDSLGITVDSASFSYAGLTLFRNLNATFEAGQTTCLLGTSGIGKSSLLRLIAGLVRPTSGHVLGSDGEPLSGRIAYMDQRDLLMPWKSVINNVVLGARLRGTSPDFGRAHEMLRAVGLADKIHARPAQLSGGQRQRVALARTLMEDRPIVLMDEPFSALDALTRHHIQALAANLLRGRTVVLVTHDPQEALRIGDQIRILKGSPATLGDPIIAPGATPRDPIDPVINTLHHELLAALGVSNSPDNDFETGAAL